MLAHLHISPDNARALIGGGAYGNSSTNIFHLDDLQCDGTETDIFDCPAAADDNCALNEAAAASCLPITDPPSACKSNPQTRLEQNSS